MLKAAADTTEQFIIIFNVSAGLFQTAVSTSMMPLLMPPTRSWPGMPRH
jgi:hypothetical protein